MDTYTVRGGQNIFDVAMTLHGSVEGVFDLLLSNDGLAFDTPLNVGQKLYYHTDFTINQDITTWFIDNKILVKNGNNKVEAADIPAIFALWLYCYQPSVYDSLAAMSIGERKAYMQQFDLPRIIINQYGIDSTILTWLKPNSYMVIDWGDSTAPQIIGNTEEEEELLHAYKSIGHHEIKIYGNFSLYTLDLTSVNGTYYAIDTISVDHFTESTNISELQTLFNQSE